MAICDSTKQALDKSKIKRYTVFMFLIENIKNWKTARELEKEHDFALRINHAIDLLQIAKSHSSPLPEDFEEGAKKYQDYYSFVFDNPDVHRFMESRALIEWGKEIFGSDFKPTPREELDTHWS